MINVSIKVVSSWRKLVEIATPNALALLKTSNGPGIRIGEYGSTAFGCISGMFCGFFLSFMLYSVLFSKSTLYSIDDGTHLVHLTEMMQLAADLNEHILEQEKSQEIPGVLELHFETLERRIQGILEINSREESDMTQHVANIFESALKSIKSDILRVIQAAEKNNSLVSEKYRKWWVKLKEAIDFELRILAHEATPSRRHPLLVNSVVGAHLRIHRNGISSSTAEDNISSNPSSKDAHVQIFFEKGLELLGNKKLVGMLKECSGNDIGTFIEQTNDYIASPSICKEALESCEDLKSISDLLEMEKSTCGVVEVIRFVNSVQFVELERMKALFKTQHDKILEQLRDMILEKRIIPRAWLLIF